MGDREEREGVEVQVEVHISFCTFAETTKALNDPLLAGSRGFNVKAMQCLWGFSRAFEENPSDNPEESGLADNEQAM